jgi:hypothetical protein
MEFLKVQGQDCRGTNYGFSTRFNFAIHILFLTVIEIVYFHICIFHAYYPRGGRQNDGRRSYTAIPTNGNLQYWLYRCSSAFKFKISVVCWMVTCLSRKSYGEESLELKKKKKSMSKSPEARHLLHSGYFHPVLRKLQAPNVEISPYNLMFPIFVG